MDILPLQFLGCLIRVFVPKGIPYHGKVKAGTRTIHCFGGRRINQ